MIEVLETYSADGIHAEIVGGRKPVTISPAPAVTYPGYYVDSIHMSRPGYWTRPCHVPAGYLVRWGKHDYSRTTDYNRAVEIALYHAKRREVKKQ